MILDQSRAMITWYSIFYYCNVSYPCPYFFPTHSLMFLILSIWERERSHFSHKFPLFFSPQTLTFWSCSLFGFNPVKLLYLFPPSSSEIGYHFVYLVCPRSVIDERHLYPTLIMDSFSGISCCFFLSPSLHLITASESMVWICKAPRLHPIIQSMPIVRHIKLLLSGCCSMLRVYSSVNLSAALSISIVISMAKAQRYSCFLLSSQVWGTIHPPQSMTSLRTLTVWRPMMDWSSPRNMRWDLRIVRYVFIDGPRESHFLLPTWMLFFFWVSVHWPWSAVYMGEFKPGSEQTKESLCKRNCIWPLPCHSYLSGW